MKNKEEFNLEERVNRLEHKMDVLFDQIVDIKIMLKKQDLIERRNEAKSQNQKNQEELNYLEMELDNIWRDSSRLREEYQNINYNCDICERNL